MDKRQFKNPLNICDLVAEWSGAGLIDSLKLLFVSLSLGNSEKVIELKLLQAYTGSGTVTHIMFSDFFLVIIVVSGRTSYCAQNKNNLHFWFA